MRSVNAHVGHVTGWLTGSLMLATLVAAPNEARAQGAVTALDFLAGRWTIHDATGARVGDAVIELQEPGAMLFERRTLGAARPQPLWFANYETGGWRQLFVSVGGTLREFLTQSAPGEWPVVMGADVATQDGRRTRFRLVMSRASNDDTRRLLESSRDGGTTWTTVFDYRYRRLPTP